MRFEPLPGPHGRFNVTVTPRFLVGSQQVGWQGAFFTDNHGASEGTVDHPRARYRIQRGLHHESRRALGRSEWTPFPRGFSVWRAGDEQRFDWRGGGHSRFLFIDPHVTESVLVDVRPLPLWATSAPRTHTGWV